MLHYSGRAGRARAVWIVGHEASFAQFRGSVSLDRVLGTAERVLKESVPVTFQKERSSDSRGVSCLTPSGSSSSTTNSVSKKRSLQESKAAGAVRPTRLPSSDRQDPGPRRLSSLIASKSGSELTIHSHPASRACAA